MAAIIEVFRTNIDSEKAAESIINEIRLLIPDVSVNFDLDDCDHILRLVTPKYDVVYQVAAIVLNHGFECEILPD